MIYIAEYLYTSAHLRQVGKIKEYNEPNPVDGFLNRVRAELQRPTDTDFHVVRF